MTQAEKSDVRVGQAAQAEKRLNGVYGLCPEQYYVRLDAYNIRVRVCAYGPESAPPLLIVPGNTGDCFPFIPLIARLPAFRVLALDRPGGGLSEGFNHRTAPFRALALDTLTAVLDAFKIDRVPLLAHSMGAHWSLWFAMENPARVSRLALLGAPGNVLGCRPPLPLRLGSIPGLNRRLFAAITPKNTQSALKSLGFLGHSAANLGRLPGEMAECYYHFQRLPSYEVSSLSLMEQTNTLFGSKRAVHIGKAALAGVSQPVLLLWGARDPFGTTAKGRAVAAALPACTFRVVPGAGHLPWLDHPRACERAVGGFLRERARPAP